MKTGAALFDRRPPRNQTGVYTDDGKRYPLPPGLGCFPLRHVDDFSSRVPGSWHERGGVMMPMFQSEAMWLNFSSHTGYPFLVKVAAGKINAATGEEWRDRVGRDPQDYLVVPDQPWLDGYCVEKGEIRQFIAMPLGEGYSVEEQITGKAEHGGVQLLIHPMKAEEWEKRKTRRVCDDVLYDMASEEPCAAPAMEMGLGAGGRMQQEIYEDPHPFEVWDLTHRSRCFVHIANSIAWRAITSEDPPHMPPTAKEYSDAGLPWFDYYSDEKALEGGDALKTIKSVKTLADEKSKVALPENESVTTKNIVRLGPKKTRDQVREGRF